MTTDPWEAFCVWWDENGTDDDGPEKGYAWAAWRAGRATGTAITPEAVERWAREAGAYFAKDDFGDVPEVECTLDILARFAALARASMQEEAAKVCEDARVNAASYFEINERLCDYAAAIRALNP